MLRGVLAIRGQAAARGYGFIEVEGREDDDVFVLGSEITDEHGGPATRGEWSALDGRAVEIGDVITTGAGRPGDERAAAAGRERLAGRHRSLDGRRRRGGAGGCGERGAMGGRDPRAP